LTKEQVLELNSNEPGDQILCKSSMKD